MSEQVEQTGFHGVFHPQQVKDLIPTGFAHLKESTTQFGFFSSFDLEPGIQLVASLVPTSKARSP